MKSSDALWLLINFLICDVKVHTNFRMSVVAGLKPSGQAQKQLETGDETPAHELKKRFFMKSKLFQGHTDVSNHQKMEVKPRTLGFVNGRVWNSLICFPAAARSPVMYESWCSLGCMCERMEKKRSQQSKSSFTEGHKCLRRELFIIPFRVLSSFANFLHEWKWEVAQSIKAILLLNKLPDTIC